MRYLVLACDYDGTLAHDGRVDDATIAALQRLLASGRRLVMVTGRELADLQKTFSRLDLFEWVVAENGALLYRPSTREQKPLGPPPPQAFLHELQRRGVAPFSAGKVIVATWEPHEKTVLDVIHAMGLELHVIFNKGAVMVLPAGISKATGLAAALKEMKLSSHNTVGVGDAENDHAFLRFCECSVAVANALPGVKETADFVTASDHGAGVVDLIDQMIATDLKELEGRLKRHHIPLGTTPEGAEVTLPPYGPKVLIAGPSASGKSTVTTTLLEGLIERKYQCCVIDPEGDYENFEGAFVLGGPDRAPVLDEVMRLLDNPRQSVIVSLTGMPIGDRPPFFLSLLSRLLQMRARTGRPHWLVLDEAHHLMPAAWEPQAELLPETFISMLLVTVHLDLLSGHVLKRIDTLIAVGQEAEQTVRKFTSVSAEASTFSAGDLEQGEVLLWSRGGDRPIHVRVKPCRSDRRRHRRKYAEGTLPPDRSFFFQGPDGKLNLRAQNLQIFLQLAQGVDDATWEFHRHRHDYSSWFREGIKDETLAAEAERIENLPRISPAESRALIRAAIERDYTLPADPPMPVEGAGSSKEASRAP
jgi:hydroxymethylpyrimidine pyrophosphatase-like HAD family hydrolase